ncbi:MULTISPECIES: asparagine synthase (glutamine-hydrolyzing) [Streptomyces]|uniref:asparagine synthase (glutamine-hydrolyzing) n=1 Tax=Streptomyces TaxID=1883 RepID=UPI000A3C94E1|nr:MULTISPECIES: asparagine synthase (glutamine-hydrolyzing) [Streptomyces]MDN5385465.1 asparagine synthase (glutamine-hydrolyzing) [Streptomyces sp. LB8]MDN5385466.1 asparagine synthase (glutamine-hydrolyzing) [Streptomyces sp. LB8]
MCGITGWLSFTRDLGRERPLLQSMNDTMVCRGPDAEGLWISGHAALGHRRLSVIDLEGGRQPMVAEEDGRVLAVLTFCGEIYNFRELRTELASYGHRFTTRSDTEVALRAYLQWGEGFAEHLNGMFAMGVWNPRTEELLLVRDRMGVKPLYYFPTPDGVLFGSEPKAILANPMVPRRVDRDGLCEALDMVKTPERTVFSGMYEVRPGQLVRVRESGLTKTRYWQLEAREHHDNLHTTIGTVRDLLEDIVSRQLISDVPLCTLLSGGLDSSTVTALAHRALQDQGRGPVNSFSVDFTTAADRFEPDVVRGSADAPYVKEVVKHLGTHHREVLLQSAELVDPAVREAVLRATDLPPAYWGDMWPSLYLLFRAVREQSTVALSGESADELFGGYQWFHRSAAIEAPTFPWLTSGSARYFGGTSMLDAGLLQKLDIPGYRRERYEEAVAEVPVLDGESDNDRRMRRMTYLNLTRFVQTLLDRKDRMSMAVGLEVRVPFCDHRLVEYVFNVPWEMKSFDGREKSLLRAAAGDLLPVSVLERSKTPYPATQDPVYEAALRTELTEVLADADSPVLPLLDVARIRRVLDRPVGDVSMPYDRGGLETALWLNRWLASYEVQLDI